MNEVQANNTLGVLVSGSFYFTGNDLSEFTGPIKKGLRLIMWGSSDKRATSCSFVGEEQISIGDLKKTELVIFSPQSIDKQLRVGEEYIIGMPSIPIGKFTVTAFLGVWEGKVP